MTVELRASVPFSRKAGVWDESAEGAPHCQVDVAVASYRLLESASSPQFVGTIRDLQLRLFVTCVWVCVVRFFTFSGSLLKRGVEQHSNYVHLDACEGEKKRDLISNAWFV